MSNFLSYDDALAIIGDVGLKKLTIVESMPTASADYEGISYLYVGATTANFTNGAVYKCQEVTPATDPKTYEWVWKVAFNTAVDNAFSDSSTNALQNKIITGKFTDEDAEIADIVNVYGSKNLIPYPYRRTTRTLNNVTFTDNGDGSITINTTNEGASANTFFSLIGDGSNPSGFVLNGDYLISGTDLSDDVLLRVGTSGGSYTDVKGNADVAFSRSADTDIYISIRVNSGTIITTPITVKPMIRLASIQDDTWEPYAPTNRQLLSHKDNGILGAKNLNSYPYHETTKVQNGITYTDNGDGTVTVNGTATADANFTCHSRYPNYVNPLVLNNGAYILSGNPKNAPAGLTLKCGRTYSGTYNEYGKDRGEGLTVILNGDDYDENKVNVQIQIGVQSGTTVNNLIIKPMLRLASDSDNTYQPYADTNKGLTDRVAALEARLDSLNAITYGG